MPVLINFRVQDSFSMNNRDLGIPPPPDYYYSLAKLRVAIVTLRFPTQQFRSKFLLFPNTPLCNEDHFLEYELLLSSIS